MRSLRPKPLPAPRRSSRWAALALPFTLWCGLVAPPAAARDKQSEHSTARAEAKEQELLGRSVKLYWDAIRWGDAEKAASFVEDPQARALVKDQLEQERLTRRVEDYSLLQVSLNPRPETAAALREAKVTVRVSGYALPQQIVKSERLDQVWYRTLSGWYLRWDDPSVAAEAPASAP